MNCLAQRIPPALAVHKHPATAPAGKWPLVLLHGWAHDSRCWNGLLPLLPDDRDCWLVDLPGFGDSEYLPLFSWEETVQQLARQLPQRCVLLGWSLGGHLALALAERCPERVIGVATIATNASFVAGGTWSTAMPRETFTAFTDGFATAPQRTLQRFCGLQAQGDSARKQLTQRLRAECEAPDEVGMEQWQAALAWLGVVQQQDLLEGLSVPSVHLFGAGDALVPVSAAEALRSCIKGRVTVIDGAGHAPHITRPAKVAAVLTPWLNQLHGSKPSARLDKRRMAQSFDRAAPTYDSAARVQRQVGEYLLRQIPEPVDSRQLVDLGCGTGFCTQALFAQGAAVTAVDIAPGMLAEAERKQPGAAQWLCADVEDLPFTEPRFDAAVSNLTIQWSEDLPRLFGGIHTIVRQGGWLLFSTLGPGTLHELRTAWQSLDAYTHVNHFEPADAVKAALVDAGFHIEAFTENTLTPRFNTLRELMRELKALGAHNVNNARNRGLTGPQQLRALEKAYEQFRDGDGKLPATYRVYYCLARRV